MAEIKALLKNTIGLTPRFGSQNNRVLNAVMQENLRHIEWSYDSHDYLAKKPETIYDSLDSYLSRANPASVGGIALFHDLYENTADAIGSVINKIKKRGFKIVSLQKCVGDKSSYAEMM